MPVYTRICSILDTQRDVPLVHSVSLDHRQSAGLALSVKQKYGGREYLLSLPTPTVGGISVQAGGGRRIIGLVTKERYFDKPKLANALYSIKELRKYCEAEEISEIVIPHRICCGLDRLPWSIIWRAINNEFKLSQVQVYVCRQSHRETSGKRNDYYPRILTGEKLNHREFLQGVHNDSLTLTFPPPADGSTRHNGNSAKTIPLTNRRADRKLP